MTKNKHASERSKTQNDRRVTSESADLESLWESISATDNPSLSGHTSSIDDAWLEDQDIPGEKTSFINTAALFEDEDNVAPVKTISEKVQGLMTAAGLSESDQRRAVPVAKKGETSLGMQSADGNAQGNQARAKMPPKPGVPSSGSKRAVPQSGAKSTVPASGSKSASPSSGAKPAVQSSAKQSVSSGGMAKANQSEKAAVQSGNMPKVNKTGKAAVSAGNLQKSEPSASAAASNAKGGQKSDSGKHAESKSRKTVLEIPLVGLDELQGADAVSQSRLTLVDMPISQIENELSRSKKTDVSVPVVSDDAGGPKKTDVEIPVVADEATRIGLPQNLAAEVDGLGLSEQGLDKVTRTATDIQAMGIVDSSESLVSNASSSSSQNAGKVASGERQKTSSSGTPVAKSGASSERQSKVDPVVQHFEGTNEIYVQSKAFDSLREDAENSMDGKSSDRQGRASRNQISVSPAGRNADESNAFGIISSGVLPIVEIDKSFDSPCLELDDENSVEVTDVNHAAVTESSTGNRGVFKVAEDSGRISVSPKLAQSNRETKRQSKDADNIEVGASHVSQGEMTGEVFVSRFRLSQPSLIATSKNGNSLVNSEGGAPLVTRKSGYGLPDVKAASGELHPEDSADAGGVNDCVQFAIEHLYSSQLTNMLHQDVGEIGLGKDLETLFGYFAEINTLPNPRVLMLNSECSFARLRLVRAFLNRCAEGLRGFSCYTTAQSNDKNDYDFVTSLLSSRIGCFPGSPEEMRLKCIERAGDTILPKSDQRWGCDILFNRFGLVKHISAHKEINNLKARTDTNSLELLLNFIVADASRGPVVIAVSEEFSALNHAWRDILRQIQVMKTSNVFIIVMPQIDESPELLGSISMKCSPLTAGDVRQICVHVLASCQFPTDVIDKITAKCGNTWGRIRRVLGFLRERSLLAPQQDMSRIHAVLDSLPDEDIEIEKAYYLSFPKEHRRFLRFVSLLGSGFYLWDVARVFSLDPLPEELPWFKDKRREWCSNIASALKRTGELVLLSEDSELGPRYLLADMACFRRILSLTDESRTRMLCGAYAHLLERRQASDYEVAYAYEGAQLWADAARHWLNIAQQLGRAFYNRSAYALLKHCLTYITPMHDKLYASMMLACIEQATRLGDYDDVCNYATMLARVGYLLDDQVCSSRAYIHYANALRIQGNFGAARDVLLNAIQLSEKIQNEQLIASAYHALAELVLDSGEKGCLVNALRYAEKSLEIHRRTNDIEKLAETQTLCARIYLMRGEPERAKQSATEAYHALTVSGRWFDTPNPFITLAECATELGEPLPFDNIERGLDIADKTGNIAQQFALIQTRVRLMLNTLQRQAVREDLDQMALLLAKWPLLPWQTQYYLMLAQFDFSRKNFMKTTKSLKLFFTSATKLGSSYLLSIGYALSAELNFEVYKRDLGKISLEKTDKLYNNATAIFESVGAWHKVAETLRQYAGFLDYTKRSDEARNCRIRADKVDPYCH